jgi:hypothetical protein
MAALAVTRQTSGIWKRHAMAVADDKSLAVPVADRVRSPVTRQVVVSGSRQVSVSGRDRLLSVPEGSCDAQGSWQHLRRVRGGRCAEILAADASRPRACGSKEPTPIVWWWQLKRRCRACPEVHRAGVPRQQFGAGVAPLVPGGRRQHRVGPVQQRQPDMPAGLLQLEHEEGLGHIPRPPARQQLPPAPAAQQPTGVLGDREGAPVGDGDEAGVPGHVEAGGGQRGGVGRPSSSAAAPSAAACGSHRRRSSRLAIGVSRGGAVLGPALRLAG